MVIDGDVPADVALVLRQYGTSEGAFVDNAVTAVAVAMLLGFESGVTWASARANITDKVLTRMRELDAASE